MSDSTRSSNRWWQAWDRFFFAKEVPYGMAMTRMSLSAVMLFCMGRRWLHVREFFSSDGAPAPIAANFGFYDYIPLMNGSLAVAAYTLLLVSLFTLLIGWKTKISAWTVFLLFTYFTLQDSLSTMTKYSVISSHTFLMLALSQCGNVWSVDQWQRRRAMGLQKSDTIWQTGRLAPVWPQRLLQLFIAVVYFGAAVTKMHTPTYFSGDQFRLWLLTNVNHFNPIGEVMAMFPSMLVGFSYIAIIWEVVFIFMVWNPRWRVPCLALGALFHTMTTITLGLVIFPLVCFSIYFCFATHADVEWFVRVRKQIWNRIPALGSAKFHPSATISSWLERFSHTPTPVVSLGILAIVLGGVGLEHSLDVYGQRRSEGPYKLTVISSEEALRLMQNDRKIAEKDMLLSFDIGTWLIGGLVAPLDTNYEQGDKLFLQANMIPPHGDLFMECNVHDAQNHLIDRASGILTQDQFRYTFTYQIPQELPPGEYQIVLKSNLEEIARKKLQVKGKAKPEQVALNTP